MRSAVVAGRYPAFAIVPHADAGEIANLASPARLARKPWRQQWAKLWI